LFENFRIRHSAYSIPRANHLKIFTKSPVHELPATGNYGLRGPSDTCGKASHFRKVAEFHRRRCIPAISLICLPLFSQSLRDSAELAKLMHSIFRRDV
jgi:hypothetical protein